MRKHTPTSIRFTESELSDLEEAMAAQGYRYLSDYVRDRVFGRRGRNGDAKDVSQQWIWQEEVTRRLQELERASNQQQAISALMLHLLARRIGTGDMAELRAELEYAKQLGLSPEKLLAKLEPQLDAALKALEEEQDAAA